MSLDRLSKFELFAALDRDARERVADALEAEEVAAGVSLFREGEVPDGALFIVSGRVRVHREEIPGETELGAGDALGTLSLVLDGPRMTSAETLSRASLLRLRSDAFRRIAAETPAAACCLLEALVREAAHALRAQADARTVDPDRRND